MSDSTNSPAPTPAPALPAAVQLQKDVKKKVADIETGGKSAVSRVRDAMAEEVIVQRVSVLTEALKKRRNLDGDLKKIKPDNVFVDADGNEVMSSYSKGSQQAMKKLRERLAKLDKLINEVVNNPAPEAYDKLGKHK
jgi:hypothetical protein